MKSIRVCLAARAVAVGGLFYLTASSASAGESAAESPTANVRELLGRLPLIFESNQGQAESEVKFLSRGPGYSLSLMANEVALSLTHTDASKKGESEDRFGVPSRPLKADATAFNTEVVRMKLVGAAPNPVVAGKEALPSMSHYFIGRDPAGWRTNVSHFGKVEDQGVYPGVNLVFYGNQRRLEFDFVVSPGADPSRIRLNFDGAKTLRLDETGNLILATGQSEMVLHKPRIFQGIWKQIRPRTLAFYRPNQRDVPETTEPELQDGYHSEPPARRR